MAAVPHTWQQYHHGCEGCGGVGVWVGGVGGKGVGVWGLYSYQFTTANFLTNITEPPTSGLREIVCIVAQYHYVIKYKHSHICHATSWRAK